MSKYDYLSTGVDHMYHLSSSCQGSYLSGTVAPDCLSNQTKYMVIIRPTSEQVDPRIQLKIEDRKS